jgi:signal peptidase I
MTKNKKRATKTPTPESQVEAQPASQADKERVEETPFEALASILSVLVIGLFILYFLVQNYEIPSGSMEKTLLVGDHLLVDRITLSPPTKWMPLVHAREPRRGDIIVFIKPGELDADGKPTFMPLVKRLIGVPGDHIHLRNGIVIINGVAQNLPKDGDNSPNVHNMADQEFLDEFPSISPANVPSGGAAEGWAVDFPNHIENGDLVVPPGKYFMMGDNRHNSLDSRYWGFLPRENIIGRPLFNYWSFVTPDDQYEQTGIGNAVAWMSHVALHFFSDTRWNRTLHRVQ